MTALGDKEHGAFPDLLEEFRKAGLGFEGPDLFGLHGNQFTNLVGCVNASSKPVTSIWLLRFSYFPGDAGKFPETLLSP